MPTESSPAEPPTAEPWPAGAPAGSTSAGTAPAESSLPDHVVLTRFNVPTPGPESLIRAREGWLRERVALFERFTVPAMRQQSAPFTWIVYFDPQSPEWLLERIEVLRGDDLFVPVFREEVPRATLIADVREHTPQTSDRLLSTNLDNDDGLAVDFLAQLQAVTAPQLPSAVYLTEGLIIREGELYARTDRDNAFCSVLESWDDPVCCWMDWHNRLARHMPVVEVDAEPAWLQVVHGSNVSNRVHGRRVDPAAYGDRFGALLSRATKPRPAELITDALWHRPTRAVRESGRAAGKKAVLRVGGKDGLDTIKSVLGRFRP